MKSADTKKLSTGQVRQLLEAYYGGISDAAAEHELMSYFSSCADVPAEFEVDAAIFRAMSDSRAKATAVPAGLERRIFDATVGRKHRKHRFAIVYKVASMAAAVALLVGIGIRLNHDRPQQEEHTTVHTPAELIAETARPALADTITEVPGKIPSMARKMPDVAYVEPGHKKSRPDSRRQNSYYEVTDTAQALEVVNKAFAILDASLETGAKGIAKADIAFVNLDRTLEKICKKD